MGTRWYFADCTCFGCFGKLKSLRSADGTHDDKDRQVFLATLGEMAERFKVEIWEQSPPRHSTDADPIRGNRYKAFYQIFILLLDQFDQILGNPMPF